MIIEELDPSLLNEYALNAKKHPEKQIQGIAESIRRFGFVQPVVIDQDNTIVIGHGRIRAAKLIGLKSVPCVRAEGLTKEQIKALRLVDNRIAETGWDPELLAADLKSGDVDLSPFGIDFEDVLAKAEDQGKDGLTDPDDMPEDSEEIPVTSLGDVWLLGDHKILCWDSTDADKLQKFTGGGIDLVFTDPPYNVAYEGTAGKIKNDDMADDKFLEFITRALKSAFECAKPGAVCYVCHADAVGLIFRQAYMAAGFDLKQNIIWVKNSATLSRQDYNWRHEPILYGWKPGAAHYWCGNFQSNTVIDDISKIDLKKLSKESLIEMHSATITGHNTVVKEDKPKRNDIHPTMKPVGLVQRFVMNSSNRGWTVMDPFLGGGSTLMACERLGRKCYGVELDPKFVDRVVKRWEEFTGRQGVRIQRDL